jgi:hypothetical protein
MTPFDPSAYPTELAALWAIDRLPELGPGVPNQAARPALSALSLSSFPGVRDRQEAQACICGLWLYHDFLNESHAISQDLPGWVGAYWHGIMHRREPDPGNAQYWFRRVSANPVYETLVREYGAWDAFAFVDRCEAERGRGTAGEEECRRMQLREMQVLFDWCFRLATGRG